MVLYVIYLDSKTYVSTLTSSSDSPQLLLLTSDDTNPHHAMNKYEPYRGRVKIGYLSRKREQKCYKKTRFYGSTCSDKDKKLYYCHGFSRNNSDTGNCFM